MNSKFKEQIEAAEREHGHQLTFAYTPKDVPVERSRALFTGVVGDSKHYAFLTENDREQWVYNRNDAKFTVARDLRAALGLSPPLGKGTVVNGAPLVQPVKKKNRFRKD